MGFSNESIGYDNTSGTVTLNGRTLMKPSYLDSEKGVSYASASDIQKSVVDYYKNSGNPVVRVSDAYAAASGKYGLSGNGISYGNGTVSIGGTPLATMYIDDSGKAWARQNDVYNLVSKYADKAGAQSPNAITDRFEREYLSDIQNSIRDLQNREEFSYNPNDDPVYLAYRNKYLLEGNRASRNAMADYAALTGGYVNSAGATAGALANQYYAQQLTNTIPTLAEQAYQRYYDNYQAELDIIDRILDAYDMAYTNAIDANNQTAENARYTADSVVARDNAEYEKFLSEFERNWKDTLNNSKLEEAARDSYWTDILNTQKVTENDLKNKGYMLDNEEQGIYLEYYRRLLEAELWE